MTDEQLVAEFLIGNEKALEVLIEKYLKPIYNFTYQLTHDTGASEDITQDVFIKTWKNIASFDEDKKFKTWIYAIAKNTTLDWLRKKKALPFVLFEKIDGSSFLDYLQDDASLSSDDIWRSIDANNDANKFLALLPLHTQTIIVLHHMQGFTLIEIAETFGQAINTVKSQYRRGILQLRSAIFSASEKQKIKDAPKNVLLS